MFLKKDFLKSCKIHRKAPVSESFWILKKESGIVVFLLILRSFYQNLRWLLQERQTQQQKKGGRQETKEALWDWVVGHAVSYMIPEKNWKPVKAIIKTRYAVMFHFYQQSWTKYLGKTLVFMWDSALQKILISIFYQFFASINKTFLLGGGLSTRL